MSITVQLDLPEALAEKARAEGLLQAPRLAALLEEEVERARFARETTAMLEQIRSLAKHIALVEQPCQSLFKEHREAYLCQKTTYCVLKIGHANHCSAVSIAPTGDPAGKEEGTAHLQAGWSAAGK